MVQLHFQLSPCGSVLPVIFLCYLALSEGLIVYPRSGVRKEYFTFSHKWANGISTSGSDQRLGYSSTLPRRILDEAINTKILDIHSSVSKELVSSVTPLTELPECFQGIRGRSRVFKTTWPIKGAPPVQSIAKLIYERTILNHDEEITALHEVRYYDHQVLQVASVESHHLRLGN